MAEAIKIHDLRPAPGAHKAKTRVGRGEGSKGKTAGRGTKGTRHVTRFVQASRRPAAAAHAPAEAARLQEPLPHRVPGC